MVPFHSHLAGLRGRLRVGCLTVALLTQFPGGVLAQDTSVDEGLSRWFAAQADLRTWSSDFVQTRTLPTLKRPLKQEGQVWFRSPNEFRWELGQPARSIVVRSHRSVIIYYPRLKRAERYSLGAQARGPWKDAAAMFEAGFPRSRRDLEARFRLLSADFSQSPAVLKLEPLNTASQQLLPELTLEVETNQWMLAATEFHFADGTVLRNDFTNSVVNPTLDDDRFTLKLADGVRVTDPAR